MMFIAQDELLHHVKIPALFMSAVSMMDTTVVKQARQRHYGTKAGTVNGILRYLGNLPNRSQLRFIGHSAGAYAALLTMK